MSRWRASAHWTSQRLRQTLGGTSAMTNGLCTLLDQGVVSAASFLTGVIVGRFCSKEDFGLYMLGLTLMYVGQNIQIALLTTPYVVYGPRLQGPQLAAYTGSLTVFQLFLTLVMSLLLLLVAWWLGASAASAGLAHILVVMAGCLIFLLLREYVRQLNFGRMRFLESLSLDLLVVAVQVPLLVVLAASGWFSAAKALLVMSLAAGLGSLLWLRSGRKEMTLEWSRLAGDARSVWEFGRWPLFSTLVLLLGSQLFPWLLTSFRGADATGNLAAVLGVTNLVNPFLIGMGNYLGPKIMHQFAAGGREVMAAYILRATMALGAVMVVYCAAMYVVGDGLIRLVYGPGYAGLGLTVWLVSLGQAADVLTFPSRGGLLALERPEINFKVGVVTLAFSLTVGLGLVYGYGLLGVALGLMTANILGSGLRLLFYRRIMGAANQRG